VICLACLSGYFLNGAVCDLCSTAISNCITCGSASRCTQCAANFDNINGICDNGVCAATVTNCLACLSTSTSVCAICALNFKLVNNVCTAINCANSFVLDVASGTCVCPTGTYDASGYTPSVCLSCNTNCNNCTVSVCFSCYQGYYPVGASCLTCVDNCKTCKIGSTC
jgi:proprotein convertase subtilisin/kexin type 5